MDGRPIRFDEQTTHEQGMIEMCTPLKWMIAGTAVLFAVAGSPASAQDTTTTSTSTTTTTSATGQVPTSATPQMIEEAIQRSLARTEKLKTLGRPEQWGSEEPFVFNPNR
jgi:hypothetical protein